jgi:hypothetical protein
MTKPDPDVPDPETPDPDDARSPGADASGPQRPGTTPPHETQDPAAADAPLADDDAVWLDLVARLEGVGAGGNEAVGGTGGPAGGTDRADPGAGFGAGSDANRSFRDFDPLGLAGVAPIELSARERLAPAPGNPAADSNEPPNTAPGPRDYEAEDDGGEFVPEEPPSLAGADPMTVLAWIGAVGGPIALVFSAMFWRSAPTLAIVGMVAAFAASVVFLIMKLPGEKDEHDDGARI